MNLKDAQDWMRALTIKLAKEIANTDKLHIQFNERMRRVHGDCTTRKHDSNFIPTLRYSIPFIEANLNLPTALRFLVIHEVCHLVHSNHGWKFERLCRQNGLDSKGGHVCHAISLNVIKGKWIAEYPTCHKTHYHHSKPHKITSCGDCDNCYNPNHKLIFTNPSQENADLIKQITQQMKLKSESEINQINQEI